MAKKQALQNPDFLYLKERPDVEKRIVMAGNKQKRKVAQQWQIKCGCEHGRVSELCQTDRINIKESSTWVFT